MSKEEMFEWLIKNRISIFYYPKTKWTREDGTEFYSDFTLSSPSTQFGAYETIEEAIKDIAEWY